MTADFETDASRSSRYAQKWSGIEKYIGMACDDDTISMWVADMDFPAADCIRDALRQDIDHGFLGYFGDADPVKDAIGSWIEARHGWSADRDSIFFTHGVVSGFGIALEAFSNPGDAIILFTPVYHAFFGKARAKGREVLQSPLVERDGRFELDLDTLEASLTGNERILVHCSPHNPGGKLWTAEETRAIAAFCAKHDLLLLSDEIHMDLAFPGARHIATAAAAPEAMPRLVVLTAASKGFNIAGGETGFAIIPDPDLRAVFQKAHAALGGTPNRFGMIMTKAALSEGGPWLDSVQEFLAGNFRIWEQRIGALPGISVMPMQATYLAWVDFTGTGMADAEISRRLSDIANIACSPGTQFGIGGEGHKRFNIAMPRARLMLAIDRIEKAFADLQ